MLLVFCCNYLASATDFDGVALSTRRMPPLAMVFALVAWVLVRAGTVADDLGVLLLTLIATPVLYALFFGVRVKRAEAS